MTLHRGKDEVGVRELHDRLSEYLERVAQGEEIVVTRRGRPVARLTGVDARRPLEELERRGLIHWPTSPKTPRSAQIEPTGSVSDLVHEQRR
jgi:prevent-host-death family protein